MFQANLVVHLNVLQAHIKTLTPFCLEVSEYSESAPGLFEPFALVEMQIENLTSQSRQMDTIERGVYIAGIEKGGWHERLIQLNISKFLVNMKIFQQTVYYAPYYDLPYNLLC